VRLEIRVTIWLTLLLAAAAAVTLLGMARFESQNLEDQSTETARVIAQTTEDSLEVSMLNNAPDDIRQSVHNLEEGELIDSVTVYRRNGSAWVSSVPGAGVTGARRDALLSSMNTARAVTSAGDGTLSVFVPIEKRPECVGCHSEQTSVLGALEVRMDERPFQQQFQQSAKAALFLAAVPLMLGIVLSVWAVRRSLLKPLAQIGDASAQLAEGDLSVRLPKLEGWELAEVSTTFNAMAARLESQQADLRVSVDRLRSDLEGLEEIQTLLSSGAGLGEVLGRSAGELGMALEAIGVGIWRSDAEVPEAEWGEQLPTHEEVKRSAAAGAVLTSGGELERVPEDHEISWVVAPARRDGRTPAVVGVVWDPPRPLDQAHRDLLMSLAGLVGIAVENADLLESLRKKEESLQGLLRKTITAQEEERRRISRELHDETSQVLSALMMNIDLLESQIEAQVPAPAAPRGRVEAVKALAEEAARNLDKMMLDLRPALLDELGLIAALRWYVAQVSDLWGLPIEFEGERLARLPEHVEVAAFRIVQEAVSNVVHHAQASKASVRVAALPNALRVEVTDDGVGFDVAEAGARTRTGESVGLMGMRERAELAGGSLNVESARGRGTTVWAEIPLPEQEGAGTS
jgi:signal transduction histidine kinase